MMIDFIAFSRKIFHLTKTYEDNITYEDLKYLLLFERLSKYWERPVTVYDVSYWSSMDRRCIAGFLRRNIPAGYIVEVSKGKYEVTAFAGVFIKRFIIKFNAFMLGKIQSPYD